MQAGKTFTLRSGMAVRYNGKEYVVQSYGPWGVRIWRAPDSTLIVQPSELEQADE